MDKAPKPLNPENKIIFLCGLNAWWRLRLGWEGNVKMVLKEIGCIGVHVAQYGKIWRALANKVMNFSVP